MITSNKMRYKIGLHERHIFWSVVEADSEDEAIELARGGLGEPCDKDMEYVETLSADPEVIWINQK